MGDFPIGFGRYQLVERLAVGGMAELFVATAGKGGQDRSCDDGRICAEQAGDQHVAAMSYAAIGQDDRPGRGGRTNAWHGERRRQPARGLAKADIRHHDALGTGAFGPWMVTADEIPPGTQLTLSCRLNGELMQHATTDQMIFSIPMIIEYVSTVTRLQPGDVIVTGTPGGVGARRNPPVWLKPGDTVIFPAGEVHTVVALTRMVLYRVQAGPDRSAKALEAWPK